MANYTIERVECPCCGKTFRIKVYDIVDGNREVGLKQKILKGTFFDQVCPHCHQAVVMTYDMTYKDPSTSTFIIFADSDEFYIDILGELKEIAEGHDVDDLMIYNAAKSSNFRIVRNIRELAEKALIFDNGYDDRIIEILKKIHLELAKANGKNIDDMIFNVGTFEDGSRDMIFMVVKGTEITEEYQVITPREYEIAKEEFSHALSEYKSDNLRVNHKWIDQFLEFKEENYPDDDLDLEHSDFKDKERADRIFDTWKEMSDRYGDDEKLIGYTKENWDSFLKDILDFWYEEVSDEKPHIYDVDEELGFTDMEELIEELNGSSYSLDEHEFRMKISEDILNSFDLNDDPVERHYMKHSIVESLDEMGRNKEAENYLKKWQKEEAGNSYVISVMIDHYLDFGRKEKAIELAEKYMYMETDEDDGEAFYDSLENLYTELGDRKKLQLVERLREKSRHH